MIASVGWKKTFKSIVWYPGLLVSPLFTNWTFGSHNIFCCQKKDQRILKSSFSLTWGNVILTLIGNLAIMVIHWSIKDVIYEAKLSKGLEKDIIIRTALSLSFMVLSWIMLIMLQTLDKCHNGCSTCTCCQSHFISKIKKTGLDPDFPNDLIFLDKKSGHEDK